MDEDSICVAEQNHYIRGSLEFLLSSPVGDHLPSIAAVVCNLVKKNKPKAKSSNVAAGYKLLGRFVSRRLQSSHPVIFFNFIF